MFSIFCSSEGKIACIRGKILPVYVEGGDRDGDIFSNADLSVSCTPNSPECKLSGELILKSKDIITQTARCGTNRQDPSTYSYWRTSC